MLSTDSTPASGGRRQTHRRQNSTPLAVETVKMQSLPKGTRQAPAARKMGHRRGQSLVLDNRRLAALTALPSPTTTQQDFLTVNTTTNLGIATQQPHVLREAQPQRMQARPGIATQQQQRPQQQQQQQQQHHSQTYNLAGQHHDIETGYLISPHGTPQAHRYSADLTYLNQAAVPFDQYGARHSLNNWAAMEATKEFDLYQPDSTLSTPTLVNFETPLSAQGWTSEGDTSSTRRTSRRVSNGIADRVIKFENMGSGVQRPLTPPHQDAASYFPPTPTQTPHDRMSAAPMVRPSRFSAGYDESMEETIKPTRRSHQRSNSTFEELRRQAEGDMGQAPIRSNTMPNDHIFQPQPDALPSAGYMAMDDLNANFMKLQSGMDDMDGNMLQGADQLRDNNSSQNPFMSFTGNLQPPENFSQPASPTRTGASRRASPHRRNDSVASMVSAASIASLNIEETRTETGVTSDEITAHIIGPDPADGKWTCTFEGCNKKFGRKENIKSHVQTHLNDRQYQCPSCLKCFVRQHDLKRHAKIHTGIKPYPCECGNSFARHDALTRHRQRGMCVGAFEGVVRKVVKRGRPKKIHRPDMETRLDKSARTRRKNNMSISSVSSQSGYEDSSAGNSPANDFDMLDNDGMELVDMQMGEDGMTGFDMGVSSSAAAGSMPTMGGAPGLPVELAHSPGHEPLHSYPPSTMVGGSGGAPALVAVELAHSPAHESLHSYVSPEAIMEAPHGHMPSSHPPSPAKSVASHYNTPPELSRSSSPPARYFEPGHYHHANSSGLVASDESMLAGALGSRGPDSFSGMTGTLAAAAGEHEESEMLFKAFTHDDGMLPLDREPGMLFKGQFDDEFESSVAVGMFGGSDEMFFGNA